MVPNFKLTFDKVRVENRFEKNHVGPFSFTNLTIPGTSRSGTATYTSHVVSSLHAFGKGLDFDDVGYGNPNYPIMATSLT